MAKRESEVRGSFSGLRICSIVHIPRHSEKCPNFRILNSLFTISVLYPPLPSPWLSTGLSNEVEVKVEVEVWNGLSNQIEVKVEVEVWNGR